MQLTLEIEKNTQSESRLNDLNQELPDSTPPEIIVLQSLNDLNQELPDSIPPEIIVLQSQIENLQLQIKELQSEPDPDVFSKFFPELTQSNLIFNLN